MKKLLNRDTFREFVFKRDGFKCVVCKESAADAHHILDRKLFGKVEGYGYYLDNGVSLCSEHHIEAEQGTLSCNKLRELCKIKTIILPKRFDPIKQYDKWGNQI